MQQSVNEDSVDTRRMYSIHNKFVNNLMAGGSSSDPKTNGDDSYSEMKQNVKSSSHDRSTNMLKSMNNFDKLDDTNDMSYYDKSEVMHKNSVIDKLLIERTLAEKIEDLGKAQRETAEAVNRQPLGSDIIEDHRPHSTDHSGMPDYNGSIAFGASDASNEQPQDRVLTMETEGNDQDLDATVIVAKV